MALTTIVLNGPSQSGKSLVAIGAAKEFMLRYGPKQCAIFYANRQYADDAAKRHGLPREITFSVGRGDEDIEEFLIGKMFIVCEDVGHWPHGKLIFLNEAIERRNKHVPATVPRTIIIVFN